MTPSIKGSVSIGIDGRMHAHSGIGRYITMLLKHVSFSQGGNLKFVVFSSDKFLDGPFRHVRTRSRPLSFFEQIDLCKNRRKLHLDLFHSPQFNIPLLSTVPQVTTIHDCAYTKYPEEFSSLLDCCLYTVVFRIALKKSKRIIAVSEATKEDLQKTYGITAKKVRVVHEGVENDFFQDSSLVVDKMRQSSDMAPPYMLFVGIPRPRKNLDRILRAFAAAKGHIDEEMKIVIAGPEDKRFVDIRRLASELNISRSVVLTGSVTDQQLRALYRSAQCLLFPTLYEGFGLPILEGMASGTPVITSSRPAHAEIAGDAAFLVNPTNIEEMSEAIVKIAEDNKLREELIQKGLNRARMFSWQTCAEQTLAVYDEALNG